MWKPLLLLLLVPQSLFGDDLELEVSLSKEEIVQFEPVVLTVSLRNVSEKPQEIYWLFDPFYEYLMIYVTDSAGDTQRWGGRGIVWVGGIETSPLPPKQAVHHRIVLFPFPDMWMNKPGKYYLDVSYQFSKTGLLGAEPVPIVVKPAEGIDKKALERFRGYPQAKFLRGSTDARAIADEFDAVIREYPKSVYVPWCYYVLGRAYQEGNDEKSRALNARHHYTLLLEKFPEFPLKAEIEYEMARELFRLGKPDEAFRELRKLTKLDAKNPNTMLWLFYKTRKILDRTGDGNHPATRYADFSSHKGLGW